MYICTCNRNESVNKQIQNSIQKRQKLKPELVAPIGRAFASD